MSLGEKIKKLRKTKNMTQEQLGAILNVAKSTISQYENNINIPDVTMLKKISNYFQISIDSLVDNQIQYKPIEKLKTSIAENPQIYKYLLAVSNRKELQNLLQETKNLSPQAIEKIIKIIKIMEQQE